MTGTDYCAREGVHRDLDAAWVDTVGELDIATTQSERTLYEAQQPRPSIRTCLAHAPRAPRMWTETPAGVLASPRSGRNDAERKAPTGTTSKRLVRKTPRRRFGWRKRA
jgi:hypothetical protein